MKKLLSNKYKELIGKGVGNYISILKDNDLFEDVTQRIKRSNKMDDPITQIKRVFENQPSFYEYLFSDLSYSLDCFYEGFELKVKQVIDLSFRDIKCDYQIITDFQDRQTREIKKSVSFYSSGKQDELAPELFASLVNGSSIQWRIILNQETKKYRFSWVGFGEENLINFLNFINDICKDNDNAFKWFPIASSYGSDFIFTTEKRYNSIVELNLMPPEGYANDEVSVVHYPKGIIASSHYEEEIVPILNILCEVPVGRKEYIIYTKLWRKSKEGNLDIRKIPGMILKKLKTTSLLCNRMKWDFGKIILDVNQVLSDNEVDEVVVEFADILRKSVQNEAINLNEKLISIFRHDINTPIKSIEI